jgi:hypothetical protein
MLISIIMQLVAVIGLIVVALSIFCLKNPHYKHLASHPSLIVAQICLLQAVLYVFMDFSDIAVTCYVAEHSFIK